MRTEQMTDFERRLAMSLAAYADDATPIPFTSKRTSMFGKRRGPLLAAAAVLLLMVGIGAMQFMSTSASRPAEARVNGMTYAISIARSLVVNEEDLTTIGEVETSEDYMFADSIAYAVDGVNPDDALVVRAAPGQRDDAGAYGDWILLIRGEIDALCPYFDPTSPSTPVECGGKTP